MPKKQRITTRILIGYTLTLALLISSGLISIASIEHLRSNADELYPHPFSVSRVAWEIKTELQDNQNQFLVSVVADRQQIDQAELQIKLDEFKALSQKNLEILRERFLGDPAQIDRLDRLLREWSAICAEIIWIEQQGNHQRALRLMRRDGVSKFKQIIPVINHIISYATNEVALSKSQAAADIEIISLQIRLMFAGVILFITVTVSFLIYRTRHELQLKEASERALEQSEMKFRLLFDSAGDSMMLLSEDGRIRDINKSGYTRLGYTKEEMLGRQISEFDTPEFAPKVAERVARIQRDGQASFESAHLCKDGTPMPIEVNSRLIELQGERMLYSAVRDISERKWAEQELRESEAVYRAVIETSADGFWIVDVESRLIEVNDAYIRLSGYSREELLSMRIPDLEAAENPEETAQHIATIMREGHDRFETVHRTKSGEVIPVEIVVTYLPKVRNQFFVFIVDIAQRKQAEAEIRQLAFYDNLTGLHNRFSLISNLEMELARARRSGKIVALIFLDLDQFKAINDTLGHHIGDKLLIQVATRIRETIRVSDLVARLGGDEFVVVLSDLNQPEEISVVADKLANGLSLPYEIESNTLYTSPSIGISLYPADGEDVSSLMKNADLAMYSAKAAGGGQYHYFDEAMNLAASQRLQLEASLRTALKNNEFELYYQPQFTTNGRLFAVETLIRWNHPQQGVVTPDHFIPLSEENGLILKIGQWVMESACTQLAQWDSQGIQLERMAINLCSREFLREDFTESMLRTVEVSGIDPNRIDLEITESTAMSDPEKVLEITTTLRETGIRLSIDDFGTGYSSLSRLRSLPIDQLKIDRSFIAGMESDPANLAITTSMIELAHKLGLEVVAEGVENGQQLQILLENDCDLMQGHLFSRALSAGEFEKYFYSLRRKQ